MKATRRIVQASFLALTLACVFAVGANAEAWCPLGGVEAAYTFFHEGNLVCSLGVSNFYILAGVLLTAVLLRRAFCAYLCPIGAVSEWLHPAGRRLGLPVFRAPPRVDRALAVLKYVVLAVLLYFTWQTAELVFRAYCPAYVLVSRHGADITWWAYLIAGAILALSLVLVMPFCRWLCPLAAVLNPFSRFALTRVKRDPSACSGCRRCDRACPMAIRVGDADQVTAARCLSCLNCVDACPRTADGALTWGPPRLLGRRWPNTALVAILLTCVAGAAWAVYSRPIASFVKLHGNPPANTAVIEVTIENLTCRGRANLLVWFLQRDDMAAPLRYFKLEAWPAPGQSRARISYDPNETDEETLKRSITEPYFQTESQSIAGRWLASPFRVVGFDPLAPPEAAIGDKSNR